MIIFKPDAMEHRNVGVVLSRFEAAGFDIIGCKMDRLSPAILREQFVPRKIYGDYLQSLWLWYSQPGGATKGTRLEMALAVRTFDFEINIFPLEIKDK